MSQTEVAVGLYEDQYKFARCFQAVVASIESDVNFRLPDNWTDPESTLTAWLDTCRRQLEPLMIAEARREFASPDRIRDLIFRASHSAPTDVHFRLPERSEAVEAIKQAWGEHGGKNGVPYLSEAFVEPAARTAADAVFGQILFLDALNSIVNNSIWPMIEQWLRSLYVRYQAAEWVRRHMGDSTILGTPDYYDSCWYVPLGIRRYGMGIGQIVLDANGSVISDRTTTREQILAKLNDRKSSATPAEIGQ